MAHIVLPGEDPTGGPNPRYARSAVPALLDLMRSAGSTRRDRLVAKLVGGAEVLHMNEPHDWSRVGEANALAIQESLAEAGISVAAHDLGGLLGRSVWFDPSYSGLVRVRAIGCADRYM
jgi:chemotaxis protein CheD